MVLPLGFLKAQMDQTMQGNQWTASFHFKGLFHQASKGQITSTGQAM